MGNWEAKPNHRSTGWYVCSGKIELASVNQVLAGIDAKECEANARLMAAAPELLAACEGIMAADYQHARADVAEGIGDREDYELVCSREDAARAAIEKARMPNG